MNRTPDPVDSDPDDLDAPVVVPAVIESGVQERLRGGVPAVIIGDRRDNVFKRLSLVALVLAIFGVAAAAYGVGQHNAASLHKVADQLDVAGRQRDQLIAAVAGLQQRLRQEHDDNMALRDALLRQNATLAANGLPTQPVPTVHDQNPSSPTPQPSSSASPSPTPQPSPSSPARSPAPSPSPSPTCTQVNSSTVICATTPPAPAATIRRAGSVGSGVGTAGALAWLLVLTVGLAVGREAGLVPGGRRD